MTMIPIVMSALRSAPAKQGDALGAVALLDKDFRPGGYRPGGVHRPVAATLAAGLPAALVVAVMLSPMVMTQAPRLEDPDVTNIPLAQPALPPPPKAPDTIPPPSHPTLVDPQINIPLLDPPTLAPPVDYQPPIVFDRIFDDSPPVADMPAPKLAEATVDPRYADQFQPDYPPFEQRNEVEGAVKVRVLIGTDGRVKAVEQISSASPGFFTETRRRALSKWRFKPATRDGVPYESWQVMTVRFELRGA